MIYQFNIYVHIVAAVLSMLFGLLVLTMKKGNNLHRILGKLYFWSMIINNVTSLFIYEVSGEWIFAHTLAIVILIVIIIGYVATTINDSKIAMKTHIIAMVASYWLLMGGAINEAFLHSDKLWKFVGEDERYIGFTHNISFFIFLGVTMYFLNRYKHTKTLRNIFKEKTK